MKKPALFFLLILSISSILFLGSCETNESYKPGYSGSFGEVILVMDNQLWKSPLGDTVNEYLAAIQYGFPQDERQFTLVQIDPTKFKSVLRQHRNICQIEISKEAKEPIQLEKSKWALGQLTVTLSATSKEGLQKTLKKNLKRAAEIFKQGELNRHYLRNKKFGNKTLADKIKASRGINLVTQKDFEVYEEDSNITWITLDREQPKGGFKHQISQGILFFSLPYTDKLSFLDTNINRTMDSVLQANLNGPGKGQYMQLNYQYIPPLGKEINFKGSFGKEYRGLWRMEGNAMGGPYYLLAFLDEKKQRIVYCFGYVFSPQFKKREYLREIEGIINSVSV